MKLHILPIAFLCLYPVLGLCQTEITFVGFAESEGIRKTFEYRDGTWKIFPLSKSDYSRLEKLPLRFNKPVKWTLFLDGKNLGEVRTKSFGKYSNYAQIGLQRFVTQPSALSAQKPNSKFAKWSGENPRPILATNRQGVSDPSGWKPTLTDKVEKTIVEDALGKLQKMVRFCASPACEGDDAKRSLKESELKVMTSYRDLGGKLLINVAPVLLTCAATQSAQVCARRIAMLMLQGQVLPIEEVIRPVRF